MLLGWLEEDGMMDRGLPFAEKGPGDQNHQGDGAFEPRAYLLKDVILSMLGTQVCKSGFQKVFQRRCYLQN